MKRTRRPRRTGGKLLTRKRAWTAAGVIVAACGFLGLSVFEGGGLIDLRPSRSEETVQVKAPPNVPVEIKARHGETVFGDDVSVPLGGAFQILVLVRNIGQTEASSASIRIALPAGVRFRPGTCQARLSDRRGLRPCEDNLVNGGFLYPYFGGGSWAQLYFDADLLSRTDPERVVTLHAIANSNETSEIRDAVRIHPFVDGTPRLDA